MKFSLTNPRESPSTRLGDRFGDLEIGIQPSPIITTPRIGVRILCTVLSLVGLAMIPSQAETYSITNSAALWTNSIAWNPNFTTASSGGPVTNTASTVIRLTDGSATALGTNTNDYPIVILNQFVMATGIRSATLIGSGTLLFTNNGGTMPAISNITTSAGSLTINEALNLATNTLFYNGSLTSGGFTVNSNITGNGALIISNRSTVAMIFAGSNSYAGGTILNAGTLRVGSNWNLGATSGALTINGGTLRIDGTAFTNLNDRTVNWDTFNGGININLAANTFTVTNAIGGVGTLTKNGLGTLILSGANAYSGNTTNSAGVLMLGADNVLGGGILVMNGGALASSGSATRTVTNVVSILTNSTFGTALGTGNLIFSNTVNVGTITQALNVTNAASTVTFMGALTNIAGVNKIGPGRMALAGSNTYTGGTIISNGVLALVEGGSLASGVTVIQGASLQVSNAAATISGDVNNQGTIRAINSLVTWQAPMVISGGYISDPSTNVFTTNVTVMSRGYMQGGSNDQFVFYQDLTMQSTNRALFGLSSASVLFTNGNGAGATNHLFDLSGSASIDKGSNWLDHTQLATNFSIGTLSIAAGNHLTLTGSVSLADGGTNALYVGWLDLSAWSTDASSLTNTLLGALSLEGINLYYDKYDSRNGYLGGLVYEFAQWDAGQSLLIPIPEPSAALAVVLGVVVLVMVRRRAVPGDDDEIRHVGRKKSVTAL